MSLRGTTKIVKSILETNKQARNSDAYLYIEVCKTINPQAIHKPFVEVLADLKAFNLPSIETVGRCRRKVVENNPELAGSSEVEAGRTLKETEFREYARQVMV